jgi:hypothetical protein
MEEKKEYLQEWTVNDNFERPINSNKLLTKKTKRANNHNHESISQNLEKSQDEKIINVEKTEEIQEVVVEDAADLTEEQKLKSN